MRCWRIGKKQSGKGIGHETLELYGTKKNVSQGGGQGLEEEG